MTKVFRKKNFSECTAEERTAWFQEDRASWYQEVRAHLMKEMRQSLEKEQEAIENGTFESDLIDVSINEDNNFVFSPKLKSS